MSGLVGTWRLRSFEVRDEQGRISHPFGRDAVGFITYTSDGHMAVQLGRARRPDVAAGDWAAARPEEVYAAAADYIAYCGTYQVHEDEVVHRITTSLMPNWIGAELTRLVSLDGDTVTLATPPTSFGGRQQRATLVWHRD